MSEFDRQNEDVFSLVRENRRRSDLAPVIGYIVPQKEAQEMAVERAVRSRDGVGALILFAAQLFVLVTTTVVALA